MNRGHVLHRSPMQQMMAGNPNWWSINNMRPPPEHPSPYLPSPSSSSSSPAASSSSTVFPPYPPPASSLPLTAWHDNQELPESWSQLLLGGLVGEEERLFPSSSSAQMVDVKQESSESCYAHDHHSGNGEFLAACWGQILPASSPASCVTAFSSSILDFSNTKTDPTHEKQDHSSECNSTANGSAFKKARVQSSSSQSPFKVRKEKLGDRITALHQLVSPFGKTDTASVLSEAIGYIRFLHSQIEALSSPYMGSAAAAASHNMRNPIQGEMNCIFPEDPGQLLNDNCIKRRGTPEKNIEGEHKDLRSRGLCLVPISCTLQVGSSDNGADYWAPALGGGFR